jgi:ribosomal protein S27AE
MNKWISGSLVILILAGLAYVLFAESSSVNLQVSDYEWTGDANKYLFYMFEKHDIFYNGFWRIECPICGEGVIERSTRNGNTTRGIFATKDRRLYCLACGYPLGTDWKMYEIKE